MPMPRTLVANRFRPPWPHIFLACRHWCREALPCERHPKPAARRSTSRDSRAPCSGLATMPLARLRCAATSTDAHAARPIRQPCARVSAGKRFVAQSPSVVLSPWPRVFLARCQRRRGLRRARDALSLPRAVPRRALRVRLAPVLRLATMWPALLRRAATSNDARAACPSRKPLPRLSASKRFAARPPA